MKRSRIALLCLGLGFLTVSCENEMEEMRLDSISKSHNAIVAPSSSQAISEKFALKLPADLTPLSENLRDVLFGEAVAPSDCGPTEFVAVQNKYAAPLIADPIALGNYSLYTELNFIYPYYLDRSKQYFGADGEYTQLVVKRQRELENFWNMPNEIRINGQHSATLNDREKLADIFVAFGVGVESRADAYAIADKLLALNAMSPNLPESPYFSLDGFAAGNNLIVIGDGLVQMVSESGIATDIVWTGVLAHEWAHQVQFNNTAAWYPKGAASDPSAATRYTELEADFMAAYFMTHKRGATYNQKRVEQFFTLYFQIGDCGFANPGHHGTPAQRMAAAHLGFELADQAQKQGHILSPQAVHEFFVANVNGLL